MYFQYLGLGPGDLDRSVLEYESLLNRSLIIIHNISIWFSKKHYTLVNYGKLTGSILCPI